MVKPTQTSISCPSCGQPFAAILEQILDVQNDPTVKERLLSGRINLITCPHCSYRGMVGTPLLYHDISKPLAIVYAPMELNLEKEEREKLIGDMTRMLMQALPEESPKGHLLNPGMALTLQGLIDQVLEADGITSEMVEDERKKIDLINEMGEANSAERERLIEENLDKVDLAFLEMLGAAAQAASQSEDSTKSLRLLNVRSKLMEMTEAGQELQSQQDAMMEASKELQALGENMTREDFIDLLVDAADNTFKLDALASMGRQIIDYTTFQVLTERLDAAEDDEQRRVYTLIRDRLLAISASYEQQSQALAQRAIETLQMLMQSPDIPMAIQANIDRIDDVFLQVLQVNLEEARKTGNTQVANKFKEIRDEVLKLIQSSAPPEVQFINELLTLESEEDSLDLLRQNKDSLNPELIEMMGQLVDQLREGGNEPAAQRLELLQAEGSKLI